MVIVLHCHFYHLFQTHQPTVIEYDDREYIFEGFSLFSHCLLDNIPPCKVVRFNIEYSIIFMEEPMPEVSRMKNFDLRETEF